MKTTQIFPITKVARGGLPVGGDQRKLLILIHWTSPVKVKPHSWVNWGEKYNYGAGEENERVSKGNTRSDEHEDNNKC